MKKLKTLWMLIALLMLITGCSFPILSTEVPSAFLTQSNQTVKNTAPGSALVAIRWPVAIDDNARTMLKANVGSGRAARVRKMAPYLYFNDLFCFFCSHWLSLNGAFEDTPDNSTYYAMELYRAINKHIPENQILLEPQYFTTSDDKLIFSPLNKNVLPVAFVVDISIEDRGASSPYYEPILTIKTSGNASPLTCGALAESFDVIEVKDFISSDCQKLSSRESRSPNYWDYWFSNKSSELTPVKTQQKIPLEPNIMIEFPCIYEFPSAEYISVSALPSFNSKTGLKNLSLEIFANALSDGIKHFDLNKATQIGFAEYAGEYDVGLKEKLMSNATLSKEEQIRVAAITYLAGKEKEWVTAQDKRIADTILDGPFGQSFRATRLAIKDQSERQQQADMAMAMSMVAASANNGLLTGGHHTAAQSIQGLTTAMSILVQHQATIQALENTFYSQFGDEIAMRNQLLEMDFNGQTSHITAKNKEELRNELKRMYHNFIDHPKA